MFGFFKPKCPVDASRKAWTECRLAWLCQQFGLERMLKTKMLLPTDERFRQFDGTEESARALFQTICEILDVPAEKIVLEFDPDLALRGAAGQYVHNDSEGAVTIASTQLTDGQSLVATMAHELAHQILMSAGHSSATMNDHEHATDLFGVYSGFGIFAANSVLHDSTERYGHISRWRMGKQGYLTAAEYGYAFAVHSYVLQESAHDWQQFLRLDARSAMDAGLKYIDKTGDCLFQRIYDRGTREPNDVELLSDLTSEFDGNRVVALWDVRRQKAPSEAVVRAVTENLVRKTEVVRNVAIGTLAQLGPVAKSAIPSLLVALSDNAPSVRAEAARAVGEIQSDETTLPYLERLIADANRGVALEAVRSIGLCGPEVANVLGSLQPVLRSAFVDCNFSLSRAVVSVVSKFAADPERTLRKLFEDDEELQRLALETLEELNADELESTDATPS
jgi:hypothetical protein